MRTTLALFIAAVCIAGCNKDDQSSPTPTVKDKSSGDGSKVSSRYLDKDGDYVPVPRTRPYVPPDPNAKPAALPKTAEELDAAIAGAGKDIPLAPRDFWLATRDHRLLEVTMELPAGTQEYLLGDGMQLGLPEGLFINLHPGSGLFHETKRAEERKEIAALEANGIKLTRSSEFPALVGFISRIELGHADCYAESNGFADSAADALLMLRCLKTLKLKNAPPADPIEALKFYHWDLTFEGGKLISATDNRRIASDRMLALFTGQATLKTLWVYTSGVTDAGLSHLTGLSELGYFSLRSERVTGSGFKALAALPKLTGLECWTAGITDEGLAQMPDFPALTSITLSDTKITDQAFKHLARATKMEDLDLGASQYVKQAPRINGSGLKDLAGMAALKSLKLDRHAITDANLAGLSGLPKLAKLQLNHTAITGKGLANLATLAELEYLELGEAPVTDLTHIGAIPKLRWLDLGKSKVTDASIQGLAGANHLELLYLDDTAVTGTALDVLATLPKLETLGIRNTQVKPDALAKLVSSKSLRSLSLSGPLITDAAAPHLARLTQLTSLGLEDSQITIEGVKVLRKALPNTKLYLPSR